MKLFSLVQTKYAQFERAVKDNISRALSKYGANYDNNTIFGQLINVLGSVMQNIMLYIEDAMVEQNKYTAQRKKSIYGLAALSGYNPSFGQAAGVMLNISYMLNNVQDEDIIINHGQTVTCTQNGLQYCIMLPQEVLIMSAIKDNTARQIYAVQGKFEHQSFVATGGYYYTHNFNFLGNLDTKFLGVRVNGENWEQAASFYDMNPDGKQWTYKASAVGGIDLIFGNDKYGRALRNGDRVDITYLLHDGDAGNIDTNVETYFVFDDALRALSGKEIDGNAVFNITFASNDAVTSGSNSESIYQVKQMIGLNSRSLVLADDNNYKAILNKFSFIGYNRTWSEPGSMVINTLAMRNYNQLLNEGRTYFDLTESDFKLSPLQKASIQNYIAKSGNMLAGVSYNIFDPEICKYAMYVYLKFSTLNYDREYIQNNIRGLVASFFGNVASDTFIPKSDIIQLLKNYVTGLEAVDVYFMSEKNETALQKRQYTDTTKIYDRSTGSYQINTSTVYLSPGENPNLGLDAYGNIYLESDEQFPVLMGGWDYLNKEGQEVAITDPLIIIFE